MEELPKGEGCALANGLFVTQYREFCESTEAGEDALEEDWESAPFDGWLESRREESDRLGFMIECIES